MDEELENVVEEKSTALLQHLAVCIATGRQLTQSEAKNLIRAHIRNVVLRTQYVLDARRIQDTKERMN